MIHMETTSANVLHTGIPLEIALASLPEPVTVPTSVVAGQFKIDAAGNLHVGLSDKTAKFSYVPQYSWMRYNAISTTTYYWDKYQTSATYTSSISSSYSASYGTNTYCSNPSLSVVVLNGGAYFIANSSSSFSSARTLVGSTHYYGIPMTINNTMVSSFMVRPESGVTLQIWAKDSYRPGMMFQVGGVWTLTTYIPSISKGSFLETVSSTVKNQYPTNSVNGSYWYVYTRSDVSYSRGSYIDTLVSYDSTAYPRNGYQGGYWYVKQ